MAMNSATLGAAMKAAIVAAIAPWLNGSFADDHRLATLSQTAFWEAVATAVSTTVVNHITANAKATGADSRGDTHNLDIA